MVDRTETRPYTEVWTAGDEQTAAHYIEDDRLGVAYVEVHGQRSEEWAALLVERLPVITNAEVLTWIGRSTGPRERLRASGFLAATAGSQSVDVVAALADLLSDPDPAVRGAALFVCAYLGWPAVVPLITRMRDEDPAADLRESATRVLGRLSQG